MDLSALEISYTNKKLCLIRSKLQGLERGKKNYVVPIFDLVRNYVTKVYSDFKKVVLIAAAPVNSLIIKDLAK